MRLKLNNIELKGYKSVNGVGQTLPINDDVTVLIGANGVGKSNIVSFFQLLNYAMSGSLQTYIGENGFADAFLYYGSKSTDCIKAKLRFSGGDSSNEYAFRLAYAAGDSLIFTEETISFKKEGEIKPFKLVLDAGKKESQLYEARESVYKETVNVFISLLKNCRYFQFHDTTKEAKIRKKGYIGDNKFLRSNAGNLAAFLYGIKHQKGGEPYYQRIVRYIQQVMPQFGDFILEPAVTDNNYISLDWREKDSDHIFGVNQISDGTLRFMALATLLLQPQKTMPSLIVIDEPELGLHPTAISILAGMIKKASELSQVVIATQSPRLLDEFDANKVVVIERDEVKRTSVFKQLNSEKLKAWEEEFTTSELWEKNVIGGRP
jgi:Predicted ATPase